MSVLSRSEDGAKFDKHTKTTIKRINLIGLFGSKFNQIKKN